MVHEPTYSKGYWPEQVLIVTGAGSGIGRQISLGAARHGATVVCCDIADTVEETVQMIHDEDGSAQSIVGDITDVAVVDKAVETAQATGKKLLMANNAGVMDKFEGAADLDTALLDKLMHVNFYAPFYFIRKVVPIMIAQGGGAITNTASAAGIRGAAAGAAYTASKHALVGLTRNTAYTYAKKGIRCNAVAPGGVSTNMIAPENMADVNPESGLNALSPIHMGALRASKAEEISVAILYLLSPEASSINGVILPIDNGWSAG